MIREALEKLLKFEHLTRDEMKASIEEIMNGEVSEIVTSSFLTALRMKSETSEEIAAGAEVMKAKAEKIDLDESLYTIDTCGTGGDKTGTYNISTASAFISAAAGIPVVKHGNRSVSSKSGSADVLEALGAFINLNPDEVKKCVEELDIGFFFAPDFHKAMKNVINIRKELKLRTIFNILGPLTNPANAKAQILGVFNSSLTELIAEALKKLGVHHALVVHGNDGMDEFTVTTSTKVTELFEGDINSYTVNPEDFSLETYNSKDLKGGDAKENAEIIKGIFSGEIKGAKLDILLLNAGAAIYVGKKVESIKEGIERAREIIESGLALKKLNEFIDFTNKIRGE